MSLTQQEGLYFTSTTGISGQQVVASIGAAVQADEAALFSTLTGCTQSDVVLSQLAAPSTPTITQGGTAGSTNYSYVVGDLSNNGVSPSSAGSTTTGNATLTSTNYNTISFPATPGHTYVVYRSASSGTPSGLGAIGTLNVPLTAVAGATVSLNDTGQTATNTFVPTANSTGGAVFPGPVFSEVLAGLSVALGSLATVGAGSITAAMLLSGMIVRSGTQSAAFTDTLVSAAAIVAALGGPKCAVNTQIDFDVRNTCATYTETIAVPSSITSATGNTLTIATANQKQFKLVITNVTPGSEAATLYSRGAASAY